MVKRLYPLIALFGLAFMVMGVVYIALAQDGDESNPSAPIEESPTPSPTLTWTPSPTLTWTPEPTATLVPTDVPPTLEPPTVVPPTEALLPTLEPTVEQPTLSADPALQETPVDANQPVEITPTVFVDANQPIEATPTVFIDPGQPIEATPTVLVDPNQPIQPTPPVDANQPTAPPVIEVTAEVTQDPSLLPTVTLPPATAIVVDSGQSVDESVPQIGVPSPTPVLVIPTEITPVDPVATVVPPTGQPTEVIAPTLAVTEILPTLTLTPIVEIMPTLVMTEIVAPVTPVIEITPTIVTDPAIEVTAEPTVQPELTATPDPAVAANIVGLINYQQLQDHSGIQLSLTLPDGSVLNAVSDATGAFNFADLQPGTYILQAAANGFLSSQLEFTLEAGQQLGLPLATLHVGDTNQDNLIDLSDVMLIAANFDGPVLVPETDINGDGWIDIRDLSLVGAQFGLIGPLPWN